MKIKKKIAHQLKKS